MKRLLLICAAATAIMLTACVDVSLAGSAKSVDGNRVTLTSLDQKGAQCGGETFSEPTLIHSAVYDTEGAHSSAQNETRSGQTPALCHQ